MRIVRVKTLDLLLAVGGFLAIAIIVVGTLVASLDRGADTPLMIQMGEAR